VKRVLLVGLAVLAVAFALVRVATNPPPHCDGYMEQWTQGWDGRLQPAPDRCIVFGEDYP
jgi:hypothetical protein